MSACLPCMWQNGVSDYKKKKIEADAKAKAIQTGNYQAIVFDNEDNEFDIVDYEEAKASYSGYIYNIISPYKRNAP